MAHPVFESWEDYDSLKENAGTANEFCYTEKWEVKYLREKIKRHYPNLHAKHIIDAIEFCGKEMPPPHYRQLFVASVLKQLGIRI